MRWKVLSERVIAGATVIESPVWIPIGSMFSMVHIITTLSFLSRSNSNSYSFHPIRALSIITSWIGETSKPRVNNSSKSSGLWTKEAPAPPNVYEALITSGNPNCWAISWPFKNELAVNCGAISIPISVISSLNCSRSSVICIASISTPINWTLKSSQIPFSAASIHKLSAVCPPIVGKTASTLWTFRTSIIDLVVNGFR